MNPLTINQKQAADLLGVDPRTLAKLRRAGHLKATRIGNHRGARWLYSVASLEAFAERGGTADLSPRGKVG